MRKILIFLIAGLLLSSNVALAKNLQELRQIASAGGSLIIDLDKTGLSTADLRLLANSLANGATLTIKAAKPDKLPTGLCLHLAKEHPGKVIFWF